MVASQTSSLIFTNLSTTIKSFNRYITSFILNIKPSENFFGNITINLTADDGELTSQTDFNLIVAMDDPDDLDAIDGIEKITGLKAEPVVAGRSAIDNAISKLNGTIKQSDEI